MDKAIQNTSNKHRLILISSALLVIMCFAIVGHFYNRSGTRIQRIETDQLVISEVVKGEFKDTLIVRGKAVPAEHILLDTIQGGRVEALLAEPGESVNEGQPLVQLSNTALQLDVMSREAQMIEQLNFLRNTQITMETNQLDLRRDLLDIEFQLTQLQRQLKKTRQLVNQKAAAADSLEEMQESVDYFRARRRLTQERLGQQSITRETQLQQLRESSTQLEANLDFARQNLENLLVKAPVSGVLSELQADVGESKKPGARLGQIDVPGQYKLLIYVDEHYLDRVTEDMGAIAEFSNKSVLLAVSKVNRRVSNSRFPIEIDLPDDLSITNGQSVSVSLMLGNDASDSLLLSRGQFFNASGGNWVYVVNHRGDGAVRRAVTLGRKNDRFFQVVSGLNAGEKVITSSYNRFNLADKLEFKG